MKKIIVLSIVLVPSFAFAQFSKGQVYLGGSLGTYLYNSDAPATANSYSSNSKYNSFSLLPVFGIFLNEKVAIGGGVGYTTTNTESHYTSSYYDSNGNLITGPGFTKNLSNGIYVSSFTRYYIPISSSFYFAAHGEINFTRANNKNVQNIGIEETTQERPSYTIGVALKPVFIFFPSKKWGIDASVGSLGYNYQRYLPDVSSNSSINFNLGSFSFGLAYYFAKK